MSNRRRTTRRTSRPHPGPPHPGPRQRRPSLPGTRRWSGVTRRWRGAPWLPVVAAVVAEVGHLVTAYLEWPDSVARGVYHVVAGGALGIVAALVAFGTGRIQLAAGAAVAVSGPLVWLSGTVLGASPYHLLPVPATAGLVVTELLLAVLLVGAWHATRHS